MNTPQRRCVSLLLSVESGIGAATELEPPIRQSVVDCEGNEISVEGLSPLPHGTVSFARRITFNIEADKISTLRESLNRFAAGGADPILHSASDHWSNYKLIVFDLDSTLVTSEGIDQLAAMMGVGEQVAQITAAAMRGELDFAQSFRKRIARLRGLEESRVKEFAASVELTPGAALLIDTLTAAGYRTAIASGGFTFVATRMQRELGIHDFCANTLDISGGRVTGEVTTPIVDGKAKAEFVKSLAQRQGISLGEVIVVGDGANDIPMMTAAGLSVAYRAKPVVRAAASCGISHVGLDGLLYILQLDQQAVRSLTR